MSTGPGADIEKGPDLEAISTHDFIESQESQSRPRHSDESVAPARNVGSQESLADGRRSPSVQRATPAASVHGETPGFSRGSPKVPDSMRSHQRSFATGPRPGSSPRQSIDGNRSFGRVRTTSLGPLPDVNLPDSWIFRHHKPGLIFGIHRQKENRFAKRARKLWYGRKDAAAQPQYYPRRDADHSFQVSLVELQRIRLRKLQYRLVQHAVQMRYKDREPDEWESDLQSYIEAIKNYDYMIERSKSQRDPFLVTGQRTVDDFVIRTVFDLLKIDPGDFEDPISVADPWEDDMQPIGGTRLDNVKQSRIEGIRDRVLMATMGGAFLIGPMWLMVKRNDLTTSLVSTTLFVAFFGAFMAGYADKGKDVMSATAAYAAVLVVFVGVGNQGS
ncbi:hypothetical protein BJ166DRAFT_591896 [Pestalotiopsis sp. NC0098]|nr:hypothetical protein BJ166DRAFT_591896 [Pestalotiopsis sp. NC0098]